MKKTFFWLLICFFAFNVFSGPNDFAHRVKDFLATEGNDWRFHFSPQGTIRSAYGKSSTSSTSSGEAASRFLRKYHELFGVSSLDDLRLEHIEDSELGKHYYYRQYFSGYPVVGGSVVVHVSKEMQVFAATSEYHPQLQPGSTSVMPKELAMATARLSIAGSSTLSNPVLVVLPMSNQAILAWRIEVTPDNFTEGSRILYIQASDPQIVLRTRLTYASFTGEGEVFKENPVVTPQLSSQSFDHMDATTKLSGSFAKVYDANFTQSVTLSSDRSQFTTASDPNRQYNYDQTDPRFTEAMAYFHINAVHDHWKSLGFRKLNVPFPVFVNVVRSDGKGFDNAYYSRGRLFRKGMIVLGSGERFENFGFDADVYYHEYGHAVLDQSKPGFFDSVENNYPAAFHEAFGDISAAAITGNAKLAEFALRLKSNHRFLGRNLDNDNRYPRDVILRPFGKSEPHHTGLIVGGTWWNIKESLGSGPAQLLLYRSLRLIPDEMTFFDVRDAMVTTDTKLNQGSGKKVIEDAFALHGLSGTDPGQPGTFTITGLKTWRITPKRRFVSQNSFKKGDWIYVSANYTAANLVPGYNLIPETLELNMPNGSDASAFTWIDEIANGTHKNLDGVIQAVIVSSPQSKSGNYSVTIASRLGGSTLTSQPKTVTFRLKQ